MKQFDKIVKYQYEYIDIFISGIFIRLSLILNILCYFLAN